MEDVIADANRREDQLYKTLAAAPVNELTGVVSANGVGAGKSGGQELWSLLLTFDAWRVGSEPIRTESLTLRRRVTDAELKTFQESIDSETVIKIRGRVAMDNAFGSPQGQLEEFIGVDSADVELHSKLAELQKPVTYADERFGTLTLDRRVSSYSGTAEWNGQTINLNVNVEDDEELIPALKVAHALWDNESNWQQRVVDYAVEALLPLKNDNWLGDDETEVNSQQFKSKMTLESISVYADGDFEFWHDDGDLFWGHSIQISGNLSDGLIDADIPG